MTLNVEQVVIETGEEPGTLQVTIPAEGLAPDDDLSSVTTELTLGSVTIEEPDEDGNRMGSIELDETLPVRGDVALVAQEDELQIVFENLVLELRPEDPDTETLTGGPEEATKIGAKFSVELKSLPDDAALEVQFSKAPDVFVPQSGAVFSLAASQVREDGAIEDPRQDIAFSVQVARVNLESTALGDITVTLEVSSEWYEARIAEGRQVAMVKVDDEGGVFLGEELRCAEVPGEDLHECSASFTGEAGGFSTFALIAVGQAAATPTPTPTATAVPTPVPSTPTPTPTVAPTVIVPATGGVSPSRGLLLAVAAGGRRWRRPPAPRRNGPPDHRPPQTGIDLQQHGGGPHARPRRLHGDTNLRAETHAWPPPTRVYETRAT